MKKAFYIIILISFSKQVLGQTNLVNNPSFETYTACPTNSDQLKYATGWQTFGESPDYFNSCNPTSFNVPSNIIGYQSALTGVAYAGFVAYSSLGLAREIIGSLLTQSLTIGTKYYVSMNVSLAEFDATTKNYIPCDKVGIRFSSVPFSTITPAPINNISHVYATTIISDTMNWTKISGSFVADSNYKYIMIGNFFNDANTDTIYRPTGQYSYFYVDDICVSTSSLTCPIVTNIKSNEESKSVSIYPNPANSFVSVSNLSGKKCIVSLTNTLGIELYISNITTDLQIDLSTFIDGVYFIYIRQDNNTSVKKVIIRH
jgi:hypothetical protein